MSTNDHRENPYQPPQSTPTTRFRWKRVPYGLYCAYCGYVDEMQKDGGTVVGHLVCWAGITFFGLILIVVVVFTLQSFFPSLPQFMR